jgi:DNA-binding CsgD family transcriptional regulator
LAEVAHQKSTWPGPDIAELALSCLASDRTPRLFVSRRGTVWWANAAARTVLAGSSGLELRESQLLVEDRAHHQAVSEFLASASDGLGTLCVPTGDGDGFWLLIAQPMGNGADHDSISLVIRRTGSAFEARYGNFRDPFGLTATEYQVALLLIAGRTADEIATKTSTSVGTVRSHIRAMYGKMDVSSREMLFYRIRPFRIL